jgi:hypothetical protein
MFFGLHIIGYTLNKHEVIVKQMDCVELYSADLFD